MQGFFYVSLIENAHHLETFGATILAFDHKVSCPKNNVLKAIAPHGSFETSDLFPCLPSARGGVRGRTGEIV